jgi:hypothetical protein
MRAEEKYSRVIESYKGLLSTKGSEALGLRAFCRGRQISYRNFLNWATTCETATGIKEIESRKQRLRKKKEIEGADCLLQESCKKETKGGPILYPLHIITDNIETVGVTASKPTLPDGCQVMQPVNATGPPSRLSERPVLRGIRITFPNGVKVSIREADSKGIFFLVYGRG